MYLEALPQTLKLNKATLVAGSVPAAKVVLFLKLKDKGKTEREENFYDETNFQKSNNRCGLHIRDADSVHSFGLRGFNCRNYIFCGGQNNRCRR